MKTRITELLGIEYPVVQGAMARIADGGLAGAVSEAGGLGIIACGGARPEWIREQVARARALTSKPIGINVMLMDPRASEVAELVCRAERGSGDHRCRQPRKLHEDVEGRGREGSARGGFLGPGRPHGAPRRRRPWWPRARKPADISAS